MAFDPDKYLAEKGAGATFNPDKYLAEKVPMESHGASGSWRETPSMSEALLPSFTAASKGGERSVSDLITGDKPKPSLIRQGLGLGSDIVSGALRIPATIGRMADTHMGTSGDHPQGFRESLDQINHGENPVGKPNVISEMTRDAATLPSFMVGGPGVGTIGKVAIGGLKAGLVSAGLHQGEQIARTGHASPGEAAAEVGINTLLPVGLKGAGALIKSGVGGLKTILSKFSEIDPAALKAASNPEALSAASEITRKTGGDLSQMADDLGQKTAGMQTDEANAIASVNARRQGALQEGLLGARLGERQAVNAGATPSTLNDISAFDAGKRIESASQNGMKAAGERFGKAQDDLLVNKGLGKKSVEFGGLNGDQNQFEQAVDGYLTDAGVGQSGKQYGVIGNVSIPPGAINEIRSMKDTFKTALTTRDMLDQLRLVDNHLNFGGSDGARLFHPGSQEDLAMKGLRSRLDDALENQIARAAGKDKNTAIAAWNAHREAFSKTADAFEKIQQGLGVGKVNQESYFNRIKNIGVDDLRSIGEQAKKNPDLAPAWNELRKGFYDNILASGIEGDGINFDKIKKVWNTMDDDLKTTMLPSKVVSHIDGVLDRTAPMDFKGQLLADGNRMVGKDRQSVIGSLENIGSKAKRSDLQDLQKLDDLLGLEGKDRFSEQSKSFYLGKQLGMTDKGKLPMFSGSRTGARNTGLAIGATIGGAVGGQQGGYEGGGAGVGLGALAGVALQSPAGALMAYKLLNQIRKGAVLAERNVTRPVAASGLTSARATQTLTKPLFYGEENK